ncbi:MAG: hypothetical protein Q4F72_11775, partial [Desulfovibrionaceae bacterium]|nr:hypothetical protein [Desulfovibrionaceae bacterium]
MLFQPAPPDTRGSAQAASMGRWPRFFAFPGERLQTPAAKAAGKKHRQKKSRREIPDNADSLPGA